MKAIETSIFDLFKIGPGPSSSHTIGPMKAACHFLAAAQKLPEEKIKKTDRIEVHLYGSLSATGKGHGTDRAVLAGLLGWQPETCDSDAFTSLLKDSKKRYFVKIKNTSIPIFRSDIYFSKVKHSFPYNNTLIIKLLRGKELLLKKEYYSIGGGSIKCKGESQERRSRPAYLYSNMAELIKLVSKRKTSLREIILKNEEAITGRSRQSILEDIDFIITVMLESVERGLHAKGVLPGPIKLARKAHVLFEHQNQPEHIPGRFMALLSAYAIAAAEENASGHKVVAAPTMGSAGVIPAILYLFKHHLKTPNQTLCDGMLAASAVGFIVKHNASIAGADVGCQGEIGVASSMAAALVTYFNKHNIHKVANAAEIALEHHLGLTCDPISGYVQIPCIERNAVAAVHAFNAYILATVGDLKKQKIRFDDVVEVMLETGRDMSTKYKETSLGGLAKVCRTIC